MQHWFIKEFGTECNANSEDKPAQHTTPIRKRNQHRTWRLFGGEAITACYQDCWTHPHTPQPPYHPRGGFIGTQSILHNIDNMVNDLYNICNLTSFNQRCWSWGCYQQLAVYVRGVIEEPHVEKPISDSIEGSPLIQRDDPSEGWHCKCITRRGPLRVALGYHLEYRIGLGHQRWRWKDLGFSRTKMRGRVRETLTQERFYFPTGAPIHTAPRKWRDLSSLKHGVEIYRREIMNAMAPLRLVCGLPGVQLEDGRYLLQ